MGKLPLNMIMGFYLSYSMRVTHHQSINPAWYVSFLTIEYPVAINLMDESKPGMLYMDT